MSNPINKIRYPDDNKSGFLPLFRLLPNVVTLSSLCITLTAINLSIAGNYIIATSLLLLAGFMDGVDGRLARFLNSSSDFGAQLDSLVDFVNFGIAPGFVIYFWVNSYGDIKGLDWAMVLFFAICAALRLARFNVDLAAHNTNPIIEKFFFKGVPAPVGAAMSMLPMVLFYEFGDGFYSIPYFVIGYVFFVAIMMASRLPTISIKKIPIKNDNIYLTLLIIGSIVIGLVVRPWLTLAIICLIYCFSLPAAFLFYLKIVRNSERQIKSNFNRRNSNSRIAGNQSSNSHGNARNSQLPRKISSGSNHNPS